MPARRRWMSWPWAGQASSNSSARVQPRCRWGLGAAEPLGPAPAGVGSAREAGERCLLLWGPPHSLGLGAHQPCAGDVPKLHCSQEVAPSCGRGGSSGQCPVALSGQKDAAMLQGDKHGQALLVTAGHLPAGSDPSCSEINQNQVLLKPYSSRCNKELVSELDCGLPWL